jgi:ribA/ribD-fused uncharacterized protein
MAILEFKDSFLSNFYPCRKFQYYGFVYTDVETAYQASKAVHESDREYIAASFTPGEAKRRGKQVEIRSDWEKVKVNIMTSLLQIKFSDPELRVLLDSTKGMILEEGNTWNDTFWGVCPPGSGNGLNMLGKLLMEIRDAE